MQRVVTDRSAKPGSEPPQPRASGRINVRRVIAAGAVAVAVIAAVLLVPQGWRSGDSNPAPPRTEPSESSSPDFPTAATTGVPAGWQPTQEKTGEYTIFEEGAVVEDLRLTDGILFIRARNVTLRRVELIDSRIINDYGRDRFNGLRIEETSILRGPSDVGQPAVQAGGYTAVRVKMDGVSEGFRISEKEIGCEPVVIEDSWLRLAPPDDCHDPDLWHGDGIQGYLGPPVTVRNTYVNLDQTDDCPGTAAFFYPDQGNSRAVVENLLVEGGPYVFRLGTPGTVRGLKVVEGSWMYGAVDITDCSSVDWGEGNEVVQVGADGSLKTVGPLKCGTG